MNTFDAQEWAARQKFNLKAAIKVGAGLGLFLFIFSGGGPWISGDVAYAVLGRSLPWPWLAIFVTHFSLCILNLIVIGMVVFRFTLFPALGMGVLTGLGLFVLNQFFFLTMGYATEWGSTHAFTSHFVTGLFGAALYKAISVPKISHASEVEG